MALDAQADLDRAFRLATESANASLLADLAWDVLQRQAEARILFSGAEFAAVRLAGHGLTREECETPIGNLASWLEEGATTAPVCALISAFASLAAERALAESAPAERAKIATRFVALGEWLELFTPFSWTAFVGRWEPAVRSVVAQEAASQLAAEAALPSTPSRAARIAVRARWLSEWLDEGQSAARALIVSEVGPETTDANAWLRAAFGSTEAFETTKIVVRGYVTRERLSRVLTILAVVTGFSAVRAVVRLFRSALSARTRASCEPVTHGLRMTLQNEVLGRPRRSAELFIPWAELKVVRREERYSIGGLLVGLVALGIGVIAGSLILAEGLRGGDGQVLLSAGAVVLAGAIADLILSVAWPARGGRSTIQLHTAQERFRIAGVDREAAERFIAAVQARFPVPAKPSRVGSIGRHSLLPPA